MDISHWKFTDEQERAAHAVALRVAEARASAGLPVYTDGVAIDGPKTLDRDDAISFHFDPDRLTVVSYIANPSQFIPAGSTLDQAAAKRGSTLYLRDGNHAMIPSVLADDALSLNAGRANPAIRIATAIHTQTGKIESISVAKCNVEIQNTHYEEVSDKIRRGDARLAAWNRAAIWLRGLREKNSTHVVLPSYDPETGIMQSEDGRMEYIEPRLVNAHNIVQEAMIITNHACAVLMQKCFDYGIYRSQKKADGKANYSDEPIKHVSLGVTPYTHGTSPNRRYVDIMVHRYLGQLGDAFELQMDASTHAHFQPPYERQKQKEMLGHINSQNQRIKELYKKQRNETAGRWLDKVFPHTDPEKLKDFDPISFSSLLRAAAESGMVNEVFAQEVEARIQGKGGPRREYALVQPKDALSLFRYAKAQRGKDSALWDGLRTHMLEYLAAHPQKLEEVFSEFFRKMEGTFHISQVSFITKPHEHPSNTAQYRPIASAVVAELEGKKVTTKEFALGFSERTSATRAKMEFLRGYAVGNLIQSDEPSLPDENKVYLARKLYVRSVSERRHELLGAGFDLHDTIRPFAPDKETKTSRGCKYELDITRDGAPVITVAVKRETAEEAEQIALEAAAHELRGRGHLRQSRFTHTALATFTGRLKNGHAIRYSDPLVVVARQTVITDPAEWDECLKAIRSGGYKLEKAGKAIKIMQQHNGHAAMDGDLNALKSIIIASVPKVILVLKPDSLTIQNPPQELLRLCGRGASR